MKSFFFLITLLSTIGLSATERPNILWITSEDNSAYYVGCYGNENAQTPNIDQLTRVGNRYTHAYSNAPVCAVTRSTLLTGVYAVTQGTLHMRSRYPIPERFKPYTHYLKEAGYYCTNNEKTDYNFKGDDKSYWDECSKQAHYKNRGTDQPFFAIFNLTSSHEHCLFPESVTRYRDEGVIPQSNRVSPSEVIIPPLYPDTPEIRQDIANYQDAMTRMDTEVGALLQELDEQGLSDNTIIFYYSDHGGILPRSKRYLYETGTRVPLIISFPEKWKHLAPAPAGQTVEETVSFVDFPATLLALAGIQKPEQMMGRVFLGENKEKATDPYVFLHGDRFDEFYKFNRGITDGKYRYIRNFLPHQSAALRIAYPFRMNAWNSYRDAWKNGQTNAQQAQVWQATQPIEELFDTENDPWELTNLASDPDYKDLLTDMREVLIRKMVELNDLGFFPEAMFKERCGETPVYSFAAQSQNYPIEKIVEIAMLAGEGNPSSRETFSNALQDKDPIMRYWALMAYSITPSFAVGQEAPIRSLLNDAYSANQIRAAQIMHQMGQPEIAIQKLLEILEAADSDELLTLVLNVFDDIGDTDSIPRLQLENIQKNQEHFIQSSRLASAFLLN